MDARELITEHLEVWTGAVTHKSGAGRGNNGEPELTGIKKLRELILELAVRGKLVEQDPNDEPASELLEQIAEEREQQVRDGRIRKPKTLSSVAEEEKPYRLPKGWAWTRLGVISHINPRNDGADDQSCSFVPMSLIYTSYRGEHGQEVRRWGEVKGSYTHFADGDVAIAKITPCFENSKAAVFRGLVNGVGAGTTELHVARPFRGEINSFYILLCLKSPRFLARGEGRMTGSAGQKRVPKDFFSAEPVSLPPEKEQQRIVDKVDELMVLCDRLEHQVGDQLEAHEVLVDTLLDALTRSTDAKETAEHWTRVAEQFDTLFTTEASIDKLKQTIMQLGVMGRLVPQDPEDEPADVLLERVEEERKRVVKEAKGRKQNKAPSSDSREENYVIPSSWSWRVVNSLSIVQGGIQKQSKRTPNKTFYPYLRVADVRRAGLSSCDDLPAFELFPGELDQYRLTKGDILIVEGNGSAEEIGRCAVWDGRVSDCVYQNHLIRVRPIVRDLSKFISLYLNSPAGMEEMKRLAVTTSGLYNLSVGKIRNILLPIPPLNEQHRIVEKVDELMALCDQLKARLGEAGETRTQIADAVVEKAVA